MEIGQGLALSSSVKAKDVHRNAKLCTLVRLVLEHLVKMVAFGYGRKVHGGCSTTLHSARCSTP